MSPSVPIDPPFNTAHHDDDEIADFPGYAEFKALGIKPGDMVRATRTDGSGTVTTHTYVVSRKPGISVKGEALNLRISEYSWELLERLTDTGAAWGADTGTLWVTPGPVQLNLYCRTFRHLDNRDYDNGPLFVLVGYGYEDTVRADRELDARDARLISQLTPAPWIGPRRI